MIEIPLSRGFVALIDDADVDLVLSGGPWHAVPHGRTAYACHAITGGGCVRMHRLITGWPLVDHINGNGFDNRRSNLRPADQSQNSANRRMRSDNTSGFKGVVATPSGKWVAQVTHQGRRHWLGLYETAEEAAVAYDAEAIRLFGEYARPNFPRKDRSA